MELHHRSCVLPSNAPALSEHEHTIPSRVLQERSANRRHGYTDPSSRWKHSSSPVEDAYSGRLGGSYFGGNHLGPHFNGDKSDEQIEIDLKRLMNLLRKCEKYQKYRDRQPQTQKDREQKWSDQMEEAFFRGLIRWPPMGRRKHMLDGQLRGRNELVADSIQRDTKEPRTRKQVSSHIQVLKAILADCPQILVYMSTADLSGRRGRHGPSHYAHHRSRHASSKYDHSTAHGTSYPSYNHSGPLPSSLSFPKLPPPQDDSAPFTITEFGIFVEVGGRVDQKQRIHRYTELCSNARQSDINVVETTSWHKQYPEFNFHRTEDFKNREVLVCDASIKVMTRERPQGAELSIVFDLRSKLNLEIYDSLECSTRFFDQGKALDQLDERERKVKATSTAAEYLPRHYPINPSSNTYQSDGLLRVRFGANFWAYQMQRLSNLLRKAHEEEQNTRLRYEGIVRKELQYMTATQDISGICKETGEKKCLLTILWRFSQARDVRSHGMTEGGVMRWRAVNFGGRESRTGGSGDLVKADTELVPVSMGSSFSTTSSAGSGGLVSIPASATSSIYPSLPLDFNHPFAHQQHHHHHHQHQQHHPPQLDLDTLALEAISANDFSNPNSASHASSLGTDYSQPSLPSLSHHSQDHSQQHTQGQEYDPGNEFDFNGGHITISGCLEPTINMSAYEAYSHGHPQNLSGLPSIAGLDHDMHSSTHGGAHNNAHDGDGFNDLASSLGVNVNNVNVGASIPSCYSSTKPSWHNPGLISHLENQAEAFSDLMMQTTTAHSDNVSGNGVLDGQMGGGLWKLPSAFGEDTGVGAMSGGLDGRLGGIGGLGGGMGEGRKDSLIFELMDRERRDDGRYRPY